MAGKYVSKAQESPNMSSESSNNEEITGAPEGQSYVNDINDGTPNVEPSGISIQEGGQDVSQQDKFPDGFTYEDLDKQAKEQQEEKDKEPIAMPLSR